LVYISKTRFDCLRVWRGEFLKRMGYFGKERGRERKFGNG
jgi:hypothetical protein